MFLSGKSSFDKLLCGLGGYNEYSRTEITIRILEELKKDPRYQHLIPPGSKIKPANEENDTKRNEDLFTITSSGSIYGFSQRVIREKYNGWWPKSCMRIQSKYMRNQTEIDKDYNPGSRAEARVSIVTNYEFTSIIGVSIYNNDFFRRFLRHFDLNKIKSSGYPIVFNNSDNTKGGWYTDVSLLNLFGEEEYLKNSIIYHNTVYPNRSKDPQIQRLKDAWERCRL